VGVQNFISRAAPFIGKYVKLLVKDVMLVELQSVLDMESYDPFSLCLSLHKECLCLNSGDINLVEIMSSGANTRLLRKRSRVRFPLSANICVHEIVCLYWV
jgi:hypothetical protein